MHAAWQAINQDDLTESYLHTAHSLTHTYIHKYTCTHTYVHVHRHTQPHVLHTTHTHSTDTHSVWALAGLGRIELASKHMDINDHYQK